MIYRIIVNVLSDISSSDPNSVNKKSESRYKTATASFAAAACLTTYC